MTTTSETKSLFKQLLSKIYGKRPWENNQKVCIDCLEPRSKKISLSAEIVVALTFMCLIIKILHLKYSPFGNV